MFKILACISILLKIEKLPFRSWKSRGNNSESTTHVFLHVPHPVPSPRNRRGAVRFRYGQFN